MRAPGVLGPLTIVALQRFQDQVRELDKSLRLSTVELTRLRGSLQQGRKLRPTPYSWRKYDWRQHAAPYRAPPRTGRSRP